MAARKKKKAVLRPKASPKKFFPHVLRRSPAPRFSPQAPPMTLAERLPSQSKPSLLFKTGKKHIAPHEHIPLERLGEAVVFSAGVAFVSAAILYAFGIPKSILFQAAVPIWIGVALAWLFYRKRAA